MPKILIVSNSHDIHVDHVVSLLSENNHQAFRINLDQFPRDYEVSQGFYGESCVGEIVHIPSGLRIRLADIAAVWMRKPAEFAYIDDKLTQQEKLFAKQETDHFLFGLLYGLDCFWLSHPLAMRSAMWKGEQLQRAAKLGFNIPESIITNSPEQVLLFKQSLGTDIIYKAMSTPDLAAEEVVAADCIVQGVGTSIINDEMLAGIDAVRLSPCHFQRFIDKKFELRVTVVGDRLFAAKIFSLSDSSFVDSRDFSDDLGYDVFELPNEVAAKCLALTRSYGLNYGALDLLVTQDGEYIFLEINPNGQYLFVEQLLPALQISRAVADLLVQEAN